MEEYQQSIQEIRSHIQSLNSIEEQEQITKKKPSESNALTNHIKELQFKHQRHLYRKGKDPHKAVRIANEAIILTEDTYPCWSAIPEEQKIHFLFSHLQTISTWENDQQIYNVITKLLSTYKKKIRWTNNAVELVDLEIEQFDVQEKPKEKTNKKIIRHAQHSMGQFKQSIARLRQEQEKSMAL